MASNPDLTDAPLAKTVAKGNRREAIGRGALRVLGLYGSRGLTHRAIDQHLGLPMGTTSAYFRRREDLVGAAIQELFRVDIERLDAVIERLLGSARTPTLDDVAGFFAGMLNEVRFGTDDVSKLARYECFLLARRDPGADQLLKAMFDQRQERDTQLFSSLGAKDPINAAIRFGFAVRGAFFSLAFLPEPAERLDQLGEAYFRRELLAAMETG